MQTEVTGFDEHFRENQVHLGFLQHVFGNRNMFNANDTVKSFFV